MGCHRIDDATCEHFQYIGASPVVGDRGFAPHWAQLACAVR